VFLFCFLKKKKNGKKKSFGAICVRQISETSDHQVVQDIPVIEYRLVCARSNYYRIQSYFQWIVMIGNSDSEGEEEEILSSAAAAEESGNWTPKRAGCISAEVDNDMNDVMDAIDALEKSKTLEAIKDSKNITNLTWTRHRSSRYRDSKHPQGYEYFFCAETGETKWVDEVKESDDISGGGGGGNEPPSKRSRPVYDSSNTTDNITQLSEGYIVHKGGNEVDYFCDQQKKWAFHTDLIGLELLSHLVRVNQAALLVCKNKINSSGNVQKVNTKYIFGDVFI
jgi:hypothetical protein